VGGNRTVNDVLAYFFKIPISQPKLSRLAAAEILHDDVAAPRKLMHQLKPFRFLEIQGNRSLVAIDPEEIGAPFAEERRHMPRIVASVHPLDLDDLRPEIRQDHRGER